MGGRREFGFPQIIVNAMPVFLTLGSRIKSGMTEIKNMLKEELIKKFYRINQDFYNQAKSPLPSHGPWHHLRVLKNALNLAKGLKGVDLEVLIPACLLHDIGGAYFPSKTGAGYHDQDRTTAQKILAKTNLPKEKIEKIIQAIANHGSDQKYKSKSEPIEVTILRDADKLEAFGPVGVARIIMARSIQGDSLKQIAEKYSGGGLEKKWRSITSAKGRGLGKKNFKYSMDFFSKLVNDQ